MRSMFSHMSHVAQYTHASLALQFVVVGSNRCQDRVTTHTTNLLDVLHSDLRDGHQAAVRERVENNRLREMRTTETGVCVHSERERDENNRDRRLCAFRERERERERDENNRDRHLCAFRERKRER